MVNVSKRDSIAPYVPSIPIDDLVTKVFPLFPHYIYVCMLKLKIQYMLEIN